MTHHKSLDTVKRAPQHELMDLCQIANALIDRFRTHERQREI
jgi:hypothetical protein